MSDTTVGKTRWFARDFRRAGATENESCRRGHKGACDPCTLLCRTDADSRLWRRRVHATWAPRAAWLFCTFWSEVGAKCSISGQPPSHSRLVQKGHLLCPPGADCCPRAPQNIYGGGTESPGPLPFTGAVCRTAPFTSQPPPQLRLLPAFPSGWKVNRVVLSLMDGVDAQHGGSPPPPIGGEEESLCVYACVYARVYLHNYGCIDMSVHMCVYRCINMQSPELEKQDLYHTRS